jgi:hypothetical protein
VKRPLVPVAAALALMPLVPQVPESAEGVARELLGAWGLPGVLVALLLFLLIWPDIRKKWANDNGKRDPSSESHRDQFQLLRELKDVLIKLEARLEQMPTREYLANIAKENRHAANNNADAIIKAIGNSEAAILEVVQPRRGGF